MCGKWESSLLEINNISLIPYKINLVPILTTRITFTLLGLCFYTCQVIFNYINQNANTIALGGSHV